MGDTRPKTTLTWLAQLINDDLKPVEVARRVWGPWNFVGFWVADCFNINTWMIGGSQPIPSPAICY
jgi:nucleobase:cation symporter-1, NCS1 family